MKRQYLLPLLLLSGFAGVAYELLWVRLLALGFGSTTLSFSVVLAAFFSGLALGSRWAGERLATTAAPVRAYAALELVTGVLALLLFPAMRQAGPLLALVDVGDGALAAGARLVLAAVILLPPTFLMGATLPFVMLAMVSEDDEVGTGTAVIYGLNTLGACLGAYVITFWAIPHLGVWFSTLATAGLNFLAAGLAYASSRAPGGDGPASTAPRASTQGPAAAPPDMRVESLASLVAFVTGFVAVAAQVVWGRMFSIILGGTVYGVGSVLVSVLLGIALGSLVASRLSRSSREPFLMVGAAQFAFLVGLVLFGLLLPLADYLASTMRLSGLEDRALDHANLAVVFLTLITATTASGATLPLLVSAVEAAASRAGTALARLYAVNTVGCILGSVLAAFVLLPELGSSATVYLLLVLLAGTNAIVLLVLARRSLAPALALSAAGLLLVAQDWNIDAARVAGFRPSGDFTFWSYLSRGKSMERKALFIEGDAASVVLNRGEDPGSFGLSLNGLGQGGRNALPPEFVWESTLVAAVPAAHTLQPGRALVIGLGAGATVKAFREFGVPQVEVIELERGVVTAVNTIWGEESPLKDPAVTLRLDDARHQLLRNARRNAPGFDIIASMPAHPWVAPALFTQEFFALARANLTPDGVFSTWFGVGRAQQPAIEGLLGAFTSVFPQHIIYYLRETGAFYLVGGPGLVNFYPDRWSSLARTRPFRGIRPERRNPAFLVLNAVAASSPESPFPARFVNTDDNGLVEFSVGKLGIKLADIVNRFPQRHLPAGRMPSSDASALALNLIETALGTPGGTLPPPSQPADLEAARRMTSGARQALSVELLPYLDGRLAVLAGRLDEAGATLGKLAPGPLEERLAAFIAFARPADQRLAALRALPARPDVLAARAALGERELPASALDPEVPLTLLGAPASAWASISPGARGQVAAGLLREVGRFQSEALSGLVEERARAAGWTDLEALARSQVEEARRLASGKELDRAMESGRSRKFSDAVAAYRQANAIRPLPPPALRLFLAAAVGARDATGLMEARQLMIVRGYQPEYVTALERTLAEHPELQSPPASAGPGTQQRSDAGP